MNTPAHIFLAAEALLITLGCARLARPAEPRGLRIAATALFASTLALGAYAAITWSDAAGFG